MIYLLVELVSVDTEQPNSPLEGLPEFQSEKPQVLTIYKLLLIILIESVSQNYNGIKRQIIKLFLRQIDRIFRNILVLPEKQPIGYVLAIFESEFETSKIKRDFFDLK